MDRRQSHEDIPVAAELFHRFEELKRSVQQFTSGTGLWVIVALILLLWLGSGLYVVGPGERGVVLLFREAIEQTEPGLRYRLPWPIQSHEIVDIAQVRRAEVGFRTVAEETQGRDTRGDARTVPGEALMLTGDENIVELQFFVQYRIQDPVKFLFGANDPEGILHTSAEVALRSAVGRNTIDYTMTDGRVEVQEQAKSALQELLDAWIVPLSFAVLHALFSSTSNNEKKCDERRHAADRPPAIDALTGGEHVARASHDRGRIAA